MGFVARFLLIVDILQRGQECLLGSRFGPACGVCAVPVPFPRLEPAPKCYILLGKLQTPSLRCPALCRRRHETHITNFFDSLTRIYPCKNEFHCHPKSRALLSPFLHPCRHGVCGDAGMLWLVSQLLLLCSASTFQIQAFPEFDILTPSTRR